MATFVLAALGTYGDVNPYIAVGLALQARGDQVRVATCVSHREKVEGEGLVFCPLRPDLYRLMQSPETAALGNDLRTGTEFILKTLVLPAVREMFDDLVEAARGADVLVIHPVLFSAPLAAESLGIKWVSVILSPGIFLSAYDPPLLPPVAWFHYARHLGRWPHRMLYRWVDSVTRRWMRPMSALREEVGLRPSLKNPIRDGMLSPHGTLGWFSTVLGAPQPDWPAKTEVTGFVFFDKAVSGAPDKELLDFLDAGAPPVVFTLGTSAVTVAGDFYQTSVEAAIRGGWRAVLLTGADPRNRIAKQSEVFVAEYAPYSELFPRAAAVVNSGGIGTIGQTLRAGVPMIVVPHAADQPDNAMRAARLGVARVIPRDRYRADRVVKELRVLLKDPAYRARAKAIGSDLRAEDGLTGACEALEKHASG